MQLASRRERSSCPRDRCIIAARSGRLGGAAGLTTAKNANRRLSTPGQVPCRDRIHVAQHVRPSFPGHHLGRKPRAGARLRGRRHAARHQLHGCRHPGRARPPAAGPVTLRHPAPRARRGEGAVGFRDRRRRDAGDHRHADLDADRECRPALQGLWRHRQAVSPGPRRLHLRDQIRRARLSRRRPLVGARDGGARGGRRAGAQGGAGLDRARRAGLDGREVDRPRQLGLGFRRRCRKSVLHARPAIRDRCSPTISTASARPARRSAR